MERISKRTMENNALNGGHIFAYRSKTSMLWREGVWKTIKYWSGRKTEKPAIPLCCNKLYLYDYTVAEKAKNLAHPNAENSKSQKLINNI